MFNKLRRAHRVLHQSLDALGSRLDALVAGSANQTDVLNRKLDALIEGIAGQSNLLDRKSDSLIAGSAGQTDLLNRKLDSLIAGSAGQTDLLDRKLDSLIAGSAGQTDLLNRKLDSLIAGGANQADLFDRKSDSLIAGSAGQTDLLNRKLDLLIAGSADQTNLLNRKLDSLIAGSADQTDLLNRKLDSLIAGSADQTDLLNRKLDLLIAGSADQTNLLNHKLESLIAGSANQTELLNRKLEAVVVALAGQTTTLRRSLDRVGGGVGRGQTSQKFLYFARPEHPNDAVNAENVLDYCAAAGIPAREIILKSDGATRSELEECLSDALAVVSTNWNLDHSCIGDLPFLDVAADAGVPVIQWLLDHPSALWPRFMHSTPDNSKFLFESAYSEGYFRRYIMPTCQSSWTIATGPNRGSRVAELTKAAFLTRDFNCMVPLNLKRLGGTRDELERKHQSLPADLRGAVADAIEQAYSDLLQPIETQLIAACPADRLDDTRLLHHCVHLVEDSVQLRRRLKVFEVASEFPVLLQSDAAAYEMPGNGVATLEQGVALAETLRRMPRSRAVISLTHVNDQIHNRTLNGLNAGCVNIIEDNKAHRQFFTHGKNALLFRYGDDSLREALALVCSDPSRIFEIAEASFALRDDPRLRFGRFQHFVALAQ